MRYYLKILDLHTIDKIISKLTKTIKSVYSIEIISYTGMCVTDVNFVKNICPSLYRKESSLEARDG